MRLANLRGPESYRFFHLISFFCMTHAFAKDEALISALPWYIVLKATMDATTRGAGNCSYFRKYLQGLAKWYRYFSKTRASRDMDRGSSSIRCHLNSRPAQLNHYLHSTREREEFQATLLLGDKGKQFLSS